MKRSILAIVLATMALGFLSAQSLSDNSYYKKSIELRALATQSFDDGDYDAAADYAAQAQEYASLSDKYVDTYLAKTAADASIKVAKARQAKADADNAKAGWPTEYAAAAGALDSALAAYQGESYGVAKTKADESTTAFDGLASKMQIAYQAKLAAEAKAKAERDAAEAKAKADREAAEAKAKADRDAAEAARLAQEAALKAAYDTAKAGADGAIAAAKGQIVLGGIGEGADQLPQRIRQGLGGDE